MYAGRPLWWEHTVAHVTSPLFLFLLLHLPPPPLVKARGAPAASNAKSGGAGWGEEEEDSRNSHTQPCTTPCTTRYTTPCTTHPLYHAPNLPNNPSQEQPGAARSGQGAARSSPGAAEGIQEQPRAALEQRRSSREQPRSSAGSQPSTQPSTQPFQRQICTTSLHNPCTTPGLYCTRVFPLRSNTRRWMNCCFCAGYTRCQPLGPALPADPEPAPRKPPDLHIL